MARKRPLSKKELILGEIDCVSSIKPMIIIRGPGSGFGDDTYYIEDHEFILDNTFNDCDTAVDIFSYSIYPAIPMLLNKGIITCFAFGPSGSGKSYTIVSTLLTL
jgi:kinesin family protein 2/24